MLHRRVSVCSLLLLSAGCLRTSIDVPPPVPPKSEIAKIAQHAMRDYAAGLAESFKTAADQLEAGELTTAAEANAQLQSANAAARKAAFQPLDEKLNDELGGERWDAERAAQIFREIVDGLNAAAAHQRESREVIAPSR